MNLKEQIENYTTYDEQEEKDKEQFLKFMNTFDNVLTRDNVFGYFTASAFVVNKERTKMVVVYHNIYDAWIYPGGHADGEENLLSVAVREVEEETGLTKLKVLSDGIYGLQILTVDPHIKRGKYVASHVHLDCCFLLEADEKDLLRIKEDENSGVKWVDITLVNDLTNEEKMKPIYKKLNEKLKNIKC